ncbi:MAG: shikimate dehydrogenase [Pseudomonadota bacterium]|nr:shikimate dehydrogenase [Pseudomonadota bacterium]
MAADPITPRLAAVIGWPVKHSLSPLLHRTWAAREGVNGHYIPVAAEPTYEAFARACDALRTLGFAGCNVTLPHKEHALRYAASATPRAEKAGAANMLTFAPDGPKADNSDIAGFAAALRETASELEPGRAMVLGAGGAARAVVLALAEMGFSPIVVANRSRDKADAVAALAKRAAAIDWEAREEPLAGAAVLVNATSLGMTGAPPLEISLDRLPKKAVVAEIIYAPLETPLLDAARARGNRTADGLSMLLHQAAFGYRAWLGEKAVVDADIRRVLEAEIARRAA